jgi:putative hydrolase of the HAD superfamily
MVPIFDLDDTLYLERSYIESGFMAVAQQLENAYGWPTVDSMNQMFSTLKLEGRGKIFNRLLQIHNCETKKNVRQCIDTYRKHAPNIRLTNDADFILGFFKNRSYIVTDGHKLVQLRKVIALGLESRLKKIFITHRYGLRHAKPSVHCFDLIKKLEKCSWQEMFYVGDNPAKDFVNLNQLGVHTIRILNGEHANVDAKIEYEAKHIIHSLNELPNLLKEIIS